MRVYETTFILSPQSDDTTFDRQIKSVSDLIEKHEGKVTYENRMGIRRLAYPIKKFTQGYYTFMVFEGEGQLLTELERHFRLEEAYIRNMTVIYERGPIEELQEHGLAGRSRPSFRPHQRDDRHAPAPEKTVEKAEKSEEKVETVPEKPVETAAPVEEPKTEVKVDAPVEKPAESAPVENEPKKDE